MRTIHNYRNLITPVINRILSRTIKCSKAHNLNASASVEGAIVIPLFIYAVMSIMFIMQVIAVRIHINNAFYVTLRKCAGYVYVYENSGNVPKGMVAETIRRLLIDEIGTDYAADHNIMGGNAGIMFMSGEIQFWLCWLLLPFSLLSKALPYIFHLFPVPVSDIPDWFYIPRAKLS